MDHPHPQVLLPLSCTPSFAPITAKDASFHAFSHYTDSGSSSIHWWQSANCLLMLCFSNCRGQTFISNTSFQNSKCHGKLVSGIFESRNVMKYQLMTATISYLSLQWWVWYCCGKLWYQQCTVLFYRNVWQGMIPRTLHTTDDVTLTLPGFQ
jgi:hypothetical protein